MTSGQSISTRPLRLLCLALVAVGVLAAGYGLLRRVRAERSSRAVELVVEYPEVEALAAATGKPVHEVLTRLRGAGATSVALPEDTLATLEDEGLATVSQRAGWLLLSRVPGWSPTDAAFTVTMVDQAVKGQLLQGLQRVYAPDNLYLFPDAARIMVRGSRMAVEELGLGLSADKVQLIARAGLRVIPRLRDIPAATPAKLHAAIAAVAAALPAEGRNDRSGIVIFDGTIIPGFRAGLPALAAALDRHRLVYGMIEFGKQKGDENLGARLGGRIVRVHSITQEELATMQPEEAVQRFGLAVKDRNIRVLYIRFPLLAGADPLRAASGYVNSIAREVRGMRGMGFATADARAAHPFAPLSVPGWLLALLFAGAGAGLLLWVVAILPPALPRELVVAGYGLLALGVLGAAGSALATPSLGLKLFGLLAAVGYPLLALIWSWHRIERFHDAPPAHVLLPAIGALLIATLITLAGALQIAAMMGDTRFLVKIGQFAGVKVALAVPLLLFGALVVSDGVACGGESFTAYRARCRERLQAFFSQPLNTGAMLIALVALAAVGLMLLRSGNDSGVGVSTLELKFRALLDQVMIARPRTKEFILGFPLFLFAMVAAANRRRLLALGLLLGAAIGQVDVLNTYCHAHTPVTLSLLRTVNGLWVGILLGALGLLLFARKALRPRTEAVDAPAALGKSAE